MCENTYKKMDDHSQLITLLFTTLMVGYSPGYIWVVQNTQMYLPSLTLFIPGLPFIELAGY